MTILRGLAGSDRRCSVINMLLPVLSSCRPPPSARWERRLAALAGALALVPTGIAVAAYVRTGDVFIEVMTQ